MEKGGVLDVEQVKKELYDYRVYMQETQKVYYHITNGLLSKVNTSAEAIIAAADEVIERAVAEALEDVHE